MNEGYIAQVRTTAHMLLATADLPQVPSQLAEQLRQLAVRLYMYFPAVEHNTTMLPAGVLCGTAQVRKGESNAAYDNDAAQLGAWQQSTRYVPPAQTYEALKGSMLAIDVSSSSDEEEVSSAVLMQSPLPLAAVYIPPHKRMVDDDDDEVWDSDTIMHNE